MQSGCNKIDPKSPSRPFDELRKTEAFEDGSQYKGQWVDHRGSAKRPAGWSALVSGVSILMGDTVWSTLKENEKETHHFGVSLI